MSARPLERASAPLDGARVLVMEDEFLIALDLETALTDLGCQVIGPFATVTEGLAGVDAAPELDAAVLDINLLDGLVMPVAQRLYARGVPVVLHSGHNDPKSLGPPLDGYVFLSKPCGEACLRRELEKLLSARIPG